MAASIERVRQRGRAAAVGAIDARAEVVRAIDDELRGVGRRGGADVGDEVRNREIDFVADRGNDRHGTRGDRARQRLVVERPEIFGRSAAASDDDDVDLGHARDRAQRAHQIDRRAVALHPRGPNDDPRRRDGAS